MTSRCISCDHEFEGEEEFYVVNPEGGYGRPEVLLCIQCLHLPKNQVFYERLKELNVLEERDIK